MQKIQTQEQKRRIIKRLTATEKNWSVTNNTDADVVVISASSKDEQSVEQMYEQSLKLLETVNSQKLIKAGSTENINLEEAVYNIIIARADNLFPVKTTILTLDDATQTFLDLSVTSADADAMKLAQKFQQFISAVPASGLAVDFAAALQSSDPAKVDAFFQSNADYKSLTLDHVVAVQTYHTIYPFVWTYYQKEKVYYLNASDGKVNKSLGKLTLKNDCSTPVNPEKTLPGFTITYTKEGGSSQSLFYLKGQFVDNIESKNPDICLQALFTLKSMLSANDEDNAIVCVLNGTVGGAAVLGYTDEVKPDNGGTKPDGGSTPDTLVHPEITKELVEVLGMLLGTALALGILCKSIFEFIKWKSNFTPEELQKAQQEMRQKTQELLDKINRKMNVSDDNALKIPEDVHASMTEVKSRANDLLVNDSRMKMLDIVNRQDKIVDYIEGYSNSDALQTVIDTIWDVKSKADTTNLSEFTKQMPDLMVKISKSSSVLNTQVKNVNNSLNTETAAAIDRAKTMADNLTIEVKNNEKFREELIEDEVMEDRLVNLFDEF